MSLLCHAVDRGRSRRTFRTASKAFSAVLIAAVGLSLTGSGAQASPNAAPAVSAPRITFGVQPGSRTGPDTSRSAFSYSATPGARMADYLVIRNYADAPVTLQTYAGDAFNGPTGAYDVLRRSSKSKGLGAWIQLDRSSVTIAGRSLVVIPFRVALPANAEPGDHEAGIVAAIITQELRSNGSKVMVEERVGARVHVRVSGTLHPQLVVRKLKTSYHGSPNPFGSGSATVTYEIANVGNVSFSATQSLHVHSLLGGGASTPKLAAIPELIPGNTIKETVQVSDVWPGVRLNAGVTLIPAPSPQFPIPTLAPIRASHSSWAMPWMLLLFILLAAALAWYLRRRRQAKAVLAAKKSVVKRPAVKRELVTAGARSSASAPAKPSSPDRVIDLDDDGTDADDDDRIDLRDTPPMKVDLRNPFASEAIDLSDETALRAGPDSGNSSSPTHTGK
jgi:hypothetical protein